MHLVTSVAGYIPLRQSLLRNAEWNMEWNMELNME